MDLEDWRGGGGKLGRLEGGKLVGMLCMREELKKKKKPYRTFSYALEQRFSTCELQTPFHRPSINTHAYITIHNRSKITVMK